MRQYRLPGLNEFIAGGDHGERRLACDPDARHARRGGDRDVRRLQAHARIQQKRAGASVRGAPVNVLPRLDGEIGRKVGGAVANANLLHRNDRVAAAGQHCPRHDFDACAGGLERLRRIARRLQSLDAKRAHICAERAAGECDAVHRHAVKGRLVALRVNVLAQHCSRTLRQRQ